MVNMKANDDRLHLISKGEEEAHAHIRAEFFISKGSVGIGFFYQVSIVQGGSRFCTKVGLKE